MTDPDIDLSDISDISYALTMRGRVVEVIMPDGARTEVNVANDERLLHLLRETAHAFWDAGRLQGKKPFRR